MPFLMNDRRLMCHEKWEKHKQEIITHASGQMFSEISLLLLIT